MSRGSLPRNPYLYQGGWLGAVIGVASAILGKKSSDKASKAASTDRARELELQEREIELSERQDKRGEELYGHYRDVFQPRETELVGEAFDRPISPAAAERRSLADVRGAFQNQRQILGRNQRRLGIDPTSGAAMSLDRGLSLEEARVEAGSRTRAREGTRDRNFSRQAQVLGFGSPTAASPYASGAGLTLESARRGASGRARESSAYAYEAAADYGQRVTDLATSGLEAWRKRRERSNEVYTGP